MRDAENDLYARDAFEQDYDLYARDMDELAARDELAEQAHFKVRRSMLKCVAKN